MDRRSSIFKFSVLSLQLDGIKSRERKERFKVWRWLYLHNYIRLFTHPDSSPQIKHADSERVDRHNRRIGWNAKFVFLL